MLNTYKTDTSPKRRDKLVILAEIMDISRNGALKTQIMYKANISFVQLTNYLKLLAQKNLLEKFISEGKEFYKATPKGLSFLERQQEIMDIVYQEEPGKNGVKLPPYALLEKNIA